MIKVEVCAGSVQDCIKAEKMGADQIELNSGIFMGGLTPSLGMLQMAKEKVSIPIYPMLRPRGGGFCYDELEVENMRRDAHLFAKEDADGLVFGFLNEDRTINKTLTEEFVDICNSYGIESIFHRAFDNVVDPYEAIETLIEVGVTRILTSGLKNSALEGAALLKELQEKYGDQIELIAGAGINKDNVVSLVKTSNVSQVHASFKVWEEDPTTSGDFVSYKFSDEGSYDVVDETKISEVVSLLKDL